MYQAAGLGAAGLEAYCQNFGGDGEIGDFDEWRDCIRTAAECQAWQAIATRWPRALDYTERLLGTSEILANKHVLAALTAIDAAMEGRTDDGLPEIVCGLVESSCGDGTINAVRGGAKGCTRCADEGETCTFTGEKRVRF